MFNAECRVNKQALNIALMVLVTQGPKINVVF